MEVLRFASQTRMLPSLFFVPSRLVSAYLSRNKRRALKGRLIATQGTALGCNQTKSNRRSSNLSKSENL